MERFVVGTGRCGSTLLMQMLSEHPDALCIFEFFNGLDVARRFSRRPVDGAAFAELLSQEHPFVSMVLKRGYPVAEVAYPFGPESRYGASDSLPWALVAVLPHLSDDPDALYDEVLRFAQGRPRGELRRHYAALFDWLARRAGRRGWIEKSGASINFLRFMHDLYPEARFLHIHRDGREAALSMREHHAFRLAISLVYRIGYGGDTSNAALARLDPGQAPAGRDPIREVLERPLPARYFGRFWTDQLAQGFQALPRLAPAQYRAVAFEDLVKRPREVLLEIAGFFDLDPDAGDWSERAASRVRGVPATRFDRLEPGEAEELREACRAGQLLLSRDPQ